MDYHIIRNMEKCLCHNSAFAPMSCHGLIKSLSRIVPSVQRHLPAYNPLYVILKILGTPESFLLMT